MVNKLGMGLLFWLISISGFGQSLIGFITLNPENAYIGQPVQLKVSVYTSTWFTKGVDLGNIQVDDALTVYFRSVSNSRDFNGKRYAGVDFYYNLFPANEGTITVPEIVIHVESPKEGGYKGITHAIKTKPKSIEVKGIPLGYNANNWLVAASLNVSEKWLSPLNEVKVGDVIQRTITRSAGGTLAEFIPKSNWDSIAGISIYLKRPLINTKKTRTYVSSSRVETVNYLFEKEGEVIIPSIEYLYWNSANKKFYRKQIDSIRVMVKPNADLAMLETIKKSLQKEKEDLVQEEMKQPFLIFGLTLKEFLKTLVSIIIVLFIFIQLIRLTKKYIQKYRWAYKTSENYAFDQVIKSLSNNDFSAFIIESRKWLNKLNYQKDLMSEFVKDFGPELLNKTLNQMNDIHFKQGASLPIEQFKVMKNALKLARTDFLKNQKSNSKMRKNRAWLNPIQ